MKLIRFLTIVLYSMSTWANQPFQSKFIPRLTLKHIEADGVGYRGGYSTLEGMFMFQVGQNHLPFIDARWHVLDRGKMAANIGWGYRYNVAGSGVLIGGNAYYDQQGAPGRDFRQLSAGIELLSSALDFRASGYFPIWTPKDVRSAKLFGFEQHNLLLRVRERMALAGTTGEFGTSIGSIGWARFYAAAGAYYFKRQTCSTDIGFQARIKGSWRDNIWAQVSVTHDQLFHTNVQGTVGISLPFWPKQVADSHKLKPRKTASRSFFPNEEAFLAQPVQRQELIVLCQDNRRVIAKSPEGQELFFIFVDNTSGSDGTFEDPYPTLKEGEAASSPGDFIYVFSGDGTTNGMGEGIVLQENQSLLGGGIDHTVATQFGDFTILALSPQNPMITNNMGAGVTLASYVKASGFDISGASGDGLFGANTQNVNIDHIATSSAGLHGLNLFADNHEVTSVTIENCSFNTSLGNGVCAISTNHSTMDIMMQDCDVSNNATDGFVLIGDDRSGFEIDIARLRVNQNGIAGIHFTGGNVGLTALLSDCEISSNLDQGILLDSTDFVLGEIQITNGFTDSNGTNGIEIVADEKSEFSLEINGCSVSGNGDDGVNLKSLNEAQFTFDVRNSTVNGNGGDGFDFISQTTSILNFIVADNVIGNNVLNGVEFNGEDFSLCRGTVTGNTLLSNGSNGFDLQTIDNAVFNFTLSGNTIDGTGIDGINIFANDASKFTAIIDDNTVMNVGANAFDIETQLATSMSMNINNNVIDNPTLDGFDILVENSATFNGTFDGNAVTGAGSHGFDIEVENNSVNAFILTNNTIDGSSNDGIDILAENNAVFAATIRGNTITNTSVIGVDLESENNTGFNITFEDNIIDTTGNNGIELRCETTSSTIAAFRGNTIQNTGADAFEIDLVGSSAITATIENNIIRNNTGDGFDILGTNNAVNATVVLRNNVIENNSARGVFITGAQNRIYNVIIEDNQINNNGNDGIFVRTLNTSTYACAINDNTCNGNGGPGVEVRAQDTASMCLQLLDNVSGTGYFLDHAGAAVYNVESPDGTIPGVIGANTGAPFTVDAAVVPVAIGTCGFPPP